MNSAMENVSTKVFSKRIAAGLALSKPFPCPHPLKFREKISNLLTKFAVNTKSRNTIAVNKIIEILEVYWVILEVRNGSLK